MHVLHIEHSIRDFESWKAAFDNDPAGREQSGVRRYRVLRPIDDPNYVMIDLDFESSSEAEAFLARMREVWRSRAAAPAPIGSPQTRIIEVVESEEY
jgi:quinol monooxygenase YgiN